MIVVLLNSKGGFIYDTKEKGDSVYVGVCRALFLYAAFHQHDRPQCKRIPPDFLQKFIGHDFMYLFHPKGSSALFWRFKITALPSGTFPVRVSGAAFPILCRNLSGREPFVQKQDSD